ncbi:MAG: amidohydrolase family protein, partial [Kiritimatiellae bacterium]|nr:amidohydrolase family protein [Kiritimatiellia bacterium]
MNTTIKGARVVTPGRDWGVTPIRIVNGVIAAIGDDAAPAVGDKVIDADGLTLLPGFVDIHSHGRGGFDFCDATDEAFKTIGTGKTADGVTSFLATGLTLPEEELAELCRCAVRYRQKGEGATCLGVHLEGPFFNAEMAGAQNPDYLRKPDSAFVKRLNAICHVKKVSLAHELEGAEACIRELVKAGIVVSGGHSAADYDTFQR